MKGLEKRHIERMDTDVTFIGFGGLEIGRNWGMGSNTQRPNEETAKEVLNTVLNVGINLIDTASAYHKSEERIGKFVSDRRNEYVLATKCGEHSNEPNTYYDFSYKAVSDSIDNSLKLLKTDVIDLIQIHFGPDPKKVLDDGETVAAMKDAKKAGKVRFLGASIDGELATRCIMSDDFDVMQLGYNMMHQGSADNISLAKEKGLGVLIRGGLGNGLFTPRIIDNIDNINEYEKVRMKALLQLVDNNVDTLQAIALNFLYNNKGISSILLGTKNPEHVKKNLELLEMNISPEMMSEAEKIIKG